MSASQEIRRLHYLQAMGVPVYVSRRDLPGARATKRLGLRKTAMAAATATSDTQARAALRESLARPEPTTAKAPIPGRIDGPESAAGSESAATAPTPEAQPVGERFSVAAVITGGRLWIEDLAGDALAVEQLQLMAAIGRALAHPECDKSAPKVAQFDWPLHDNPQLDLGPEEAVAALQSFLRRQLDEQGCTSLVCCGDVVAERLGRAALSVPVLKLPASRALLQDPLRKRELWAQLRT